MAHSSFAIQNSSDKTVSIQVDTRKTKGRMEPIWAWFGYDEPNFTTMKHGRKLLTELAEAFATPVYVRTHNLLTSGDGTPALARRNGARVVTAPRGRGTQMNAAARQSTGRFVLFLHADSAIRDRFLLADAVDALDRAIRADRCDDIAGHFRLKFIRSGRRNRLAYRYIENKTGFNRPYTTNGDQGFLLKRRFFDRLGGFEERFGFLEDQQLAEKIRSRGRWITLPGRLYSSARRFESEGFHQRYILMSIIMGAHSTGLARRQTR